MQYGTKKDGVLGGLITGSASVAATSSDMEHITDKIAMPLAR